MRISDWSSDVCSSDLCSWGRPPQSPAVASPSPASSSNQASAGPDSLIVIGWPNRSFDLPAATRIQPSEIEYSSTSVRSAPLKRMPMPRCSTSMSKCGERGLVDMRRSEEQTSELQSLMRTSYAVFCLKKKKTGTHDSAYG